MFKNVNEKILQKLMSNFLHTNSIDQYNLKFMIEFTISENLKSSKISILFMLRFKSKVIF